MASLQLRNGAIDCSRGFRYRLHPKNVLGRPDLVFPKHHAVVFVHGCFWHRHEGCRYATTPATRPEFWQAKFEANVVRDRTVRAALLNSGWRVATVWECALRKRKQVETTVLVLAEWLGSRSVGLEIGSAEAAADEGSA